MFSKVQAKNYEVKIVTGRFDVASSTQAATKEAGLGYSVSKTDDGEFTITFDEKYSYILSALASVQVATPTNVIAQIKSSSATSVVIQLALIATGTPFVASDFTGACKVNFVIHLQRSSLGCV